jgi:prepilin-type N-terminal cleavage/methylation domain-containing protein
MGLRRAHWENQGGFTLIEVMITILIMGIVFAIASSTWLGAIESRKVDSATNQMVADLRQAHTQATNRLANHEVRLTDNGSTYRIGPPAALETVTLPDGTKVDTPGATLNIVFKSDGSVTPPGAPITFNVRSVDGNPSHTIEVNRLTSRIEVDG